MKYIIKANHQTEKYSWKKLDSSIKKSFLAVNQVDIYKRVADYIKADIEEWLESKHEVTSADLKRRTAKLLYESSPESAYIFEHYKRHR